ncbi:MAG: ABC transporter permease, partial [Myxococcaceae bacterium]
MTKFFQILWVMFGATILVTGLLRLVPGDPVDYILGEQATQEMRVKLSQDLGLVDAEGYPVGFVSQYIGFVSKISQNKLLSYRTQKPVMSVIAARLPYTIILALASMLFALALGPLLGILAAWKRGKWQDQLTRFIALLGIS